jgi:hypothetical protein
LTFYVLLLILNSEKGASMITQFRTVWHEAIFAAAQAQAGGCIADRSGGFGRGASGKVARWSLERAADILATSGRARLRVGDADGEAPTPHERSLELVVDRLGSGDREGARQHAQWLVKPAALEALLRALEPIATGPARLAPATR